MFLIKYVMSSALVHSLSQINTQNSRCRYEAYNRGGACISKDIWISLQGPIFGGAYILDGLFGILRCDEEK